LLLLKTFKALNGLLCADVPLRNYSLTHSALVMCRDDLVLLQLSGHLDTSTTAWQIMHDLYAVPQLSIEVVSSIPRKYVIQSTIPLLYKLFCIVKNKKLHKRRKIAIKYLQGAAKKVIPCCIFQIFKQPLRIF